jgi:hypothetical protein
MDSIPTSHKASTIDEFCAEHRISKPFFYVLKKKGLAPRITKLGSKQIITIEDAARWREAVSAASAA